MNNREISMLMRSNAKTCSVFGGVFAADTLPVKPRDNKPCAYIANTHKHHQPGEHWVCFYFPKDSPPEFWDSYGRNPQDDFKPILGATYLCSEKMIQHPLSSVCGQYCCFYILKRSQGFEMLDIVSAFTDDLLLNDIMVNRTVEKNFQVDLDVIDIPFLNMQVARSLKSLLR